MNPNFSPYTKKAIWVLLILILFVSGYWLKNRIGVNFFSSISISSYFPFIYLKNDTVALKKPGVILYDDFETKRIFGLWSNSWFGKDKHLTRHFVLGGENRSRCLLVRSNRNGGWSCPYRKYIETQQGDVFHFEGLVNIAGPNPSAFLTVAAFDKDKQVIDWDLSIARVKKTGTWIKASQQFTVTSGEIRYITFRLAGRGVGEYRFDNILFRKIK